MNLTILCDGAQHPLEDVIVDNDIQEAEAVKVANDNQGRYGCHYKQLEKSVNVMCVGVYVCVCVRGIRENKNKQK